jgi:predicted nucleotidyltransferase
MAISQIIPIDPAVEAFCRQWKIARLDLVGSFPAPKSDITLLVTFAPDAEWGLFQHVRMERELSALMGRKVELLSRRAVEESRNALTRNSILSRVNPTPIYVAR